MRSHIVFVIACLCAITATPAAAADTMTPIPAGGKAPCNTAYMKATAVYTPIVGDIMRFDAMFENYAALCSKADSAKDMKPFITAMRTRADRDVDDSYHVMTRIIKGILPDRVAAACKADHGAQEFAVKAFEKTMHAQRVKTERRLKRSAGDIDVSQKAQVCNGLESIQAEFANHLSGNDLSNPLFEIAFLRGMVLPNDPEQRRAYYTYRDVLKGIQDEHAAKKQKTKP